MNGRIFVTGVTMALAMNAQTFSRRATMVNGGTRDQGQCTVEVSVDGAAQVEIRGQDGTLRNLKGQPAQWRRLECTAPLPPNAQNLEVQPLAGRGPQNLTRDPRNSNGTAVIQIDDPADGADIYAFTLYWGDRGNRGGPPSGFNGRGDGDRRDGNGDFRQPPPPDRSFNGPGGPDRDRGGSRFTENQAVEVCRNSIRDQAFDRFRTRNIDIRRIVMDDNPGGRDRVIGDLAVRRSFGRSSLYHFSCSVNFDTGLVRNARIDQFESQYYPENNRR